MSQKEQVTNQRNVVMNQYAEKLLQIQRKIDQVMRIKTQLDSRGNRFVRLLGTSENEEQLLENLSSLAHIYSRKENVMAIVEKGV